MAFSLTESERDMMESMSGGGMCRMTLFHPGRQTERSLNFELDPGDSRDPDVIEQIMGQIRGYVVKAVHVNNALVWQSQQRAIVFEHDRVKTSY